MTASATRVSFFDTSSAPTPAMLAAMASAELGDDVYGTDPTVNRLQELAAELLNFEAALLVPSGTMANLIALVVHTCPGDAVILEAQSHIAIAETGGMAAVAGCMPIGVTAPRGVLQARHIRAALEPEDQHRPRPRLVCIENTHNRGGGSITTPAVMSALAEVARDRGLLLHVDGARVFNAAVALGVPVRELVEGADSVTVALSKGLSCPAGSILAGSERFISEARRARKMLGGAMRQSGVLAAAGIVALETGLSRLADDHRLARRLAERLNSVSGVAVDIDNVDTNIVLCDVTATGRMASELAIELARHGIGCAPREPGHIRFVTHRGVGEAEVAALIEVLEAMLTPPGNPVANRRSRDEVES
jgi:threonine aldolase